MVQATFSLSWDMHRNYICNGLGMLQQNEEFVDMTLAADGHHVKVHQMVMALASPYIKQLISSAACSHPVIFLNKTSYTTLSAILEYIYTGEVLVKAEHLSEVIQAAKNLHIKGLEDMDVQNTINKRSLKPESVTSGGEGCASGNVDDDICYFEVTDSRVNTPTSTQRLNLTFADEGIAEDSQSNNAPMDEDDDENMIQEVTIEPEEHKPRIISCVSTEKLNPDTNVPTTMQYTVSNQGSLQMILNRYVYYLKHCNRDNSRQWRCVDYLNNTKCPAIVFTRDDAVVQRISAHTHAFHDKKILKKVYTGAVFTAIQEAEIQGQNIKCKREDKSEEQEGLST